MAIKASATISLSTVVDVVSCTRFYLLQSSILTPPAVPTTSPPVGDWDDTEPTYTSGSTNSLYFCDRTDFSDGTWSYSSVSLSSSYEAAKVAYNKAEAAQRAAAKALSNTEVIVGTQTAATSHWTGSASFSALTDGQQIVYWLPYAGSSTAADLNLTLLGGATTGPIPCFYGGSSRITTHYSAGNVVHLTYRLNAVINASTYTGWWADANYNTDSFDRVQMNSNIRAKSAVTASKLIVGDADGYFNLAASVAFDINKPVLYAASAIAANASSVSNYLAYPSVSMGTTVSPDWLGVLDQSVYLAGVLSGQTFTVADTDWITCSPVDDMGTITFLLLGKISATSAVSMFLYPEHPMFMFSDGVFRNLNEIAYNAQVTANDASEAALENAASINTLQDQISMKVSQTSYDSDKNVITQRFSAVEQTASDFRVEITQEVAARVATVAGEVSDLTSEVADFRETVSGYMDFNGDSLSIGVTGSSFKTAITNTEMAFTDNNEKVAYISNSDMYITRARVTDTLSVGTTNNGYFDFVTLPGGMALKWRTGESS